MCTETLNVIQTWAAGQSFPEKDSVRGFLMCPPTRADNKEKDSFKKAANFQVHTDVQDAIMICVHYHLKASGKLCGVNANITPILQGK